jgi:hypothetical protein
MKRRGPPNGSEPRSERKLRVAREHSHSRSDAGRASSPSPSPLPLPSNASTRHAAAPLRIMIEPTASGRKWIARLDDRVMCVTAWPFVKAARLLLAEGYPADAPARHAATKTEIFAMEIGQQTLSRSGGGCAH